MSAAFTTMVLGRHRAAFDYCDACGFLCAREPHWLDEAYSSPISSTDTGLVARNLTIAGKLAAVIYYVLGERGEGRYLDVAGGYGMLTRLMRDYGFNFYWTDKYCANLLARGFEYQPDLGPCRAVTAIEVLEHLRDPIEFVRQVLNETQAETLIFTTELYENSPPAPGDWWYYSLETGQHIAFFQKRTLEAMGNRLGFFLASAGGLHVFAQQPVNKSLLRLYANRMSGFWALWARHRLKSRTIGDQEAIGKRFKRYSNGD